MGALSKYIKETDPTAKVAFIGPCTAKKMEFKRENVAPNVDAVITFEELQALFDSKDLEISTMPEDVLDNASYYGRIFARSGGLSDAVVQAIKEQGIENFDVKSVVCDGIEACKLALMKARALLKARKPLDFNFIEGMACQGGCIGGAGCLTHGEKNKMEVDKYGKLAYEKSIKDAVSVLQK
jgi:iron only hydrogenase large subunit-like protein